MTKNRVRTVWGRGEVAMAMYTGAIASPLIVEVIGAAGFDAAYLDMEHTSMDLGCILNMVIAAERAGISPIVRIPSFDAALIGRLLDMGVQGIYVPHVNDANLAREAVRAVRYPPLGDRGLMPSSRVAQFGAVSVDRHCAESNQEIIVAVQIEDRRGVEQIDSIASVEGLDLVAVGPFDLAVDLGVHDTPNHSDLVAAIEAVAVAVRRHGKHLAVPSTALFKREPTEMRDLGVTFMNMAPVPENRLRRLLSAELNAVREKLSMSGTPVSA